MFLRPVVKAPDRLEKDPMYYRTHRDSAPPPLLVERREGSHRLPFVDYNPNLPPAAFPSLDPLSCPPAFEATTSDLNADEDHTNVEPSSQVTSKPHDETQTNEKEVQSQEESLKCKTIAGNDDHIHQSLVSNLEEFDKGELKPDSEVR
jgi:hypothetical protein